MAAQRGEALVPRVVSYLSSLLQRIAESNDENRHLRQKDLSTVFRGSELPSISVTDYLERIYSYANCSPCCYVVAYIYLDRFARHQPLVGVDSFSVHRLLITSVVVATKFMDDVCYNNAFFAKVGGISTLEMNLMEMDFLFGLNFQLNVTPTTFQSYCLLLEREMCLENPTVSRRSQCFFFSESEEQNIKQQQQQQKRRTVLI